MEQSTSDVRRKSGRPRSFDRAAALHLAMLAFWRHGYETTSITDLTAAMGITPPSLYAAFGSKEQLFREAVRLYLGDPATMERSIEEAPTAFDAARDFLTASAAAFTGAGTPRGCLLASATASGSAASLEVQRAIAEIRRDVVARFTRRIERDVRNGVLPPDTQAAALAGLLMAVTQGMSVLARDGAARGELMAIADAALRAWPRNRPETA